MTTKFAEKKLKLKFVEYEIVEGYTILLDQNDLDLVRARHWYIARKNKSQTISFITSVKTAYRRYRKVSLQTFLLNDKHGLIARHIDPNSSHDYRRSNLQLFSSQEQSQTFGKRKSTCSSIYKGVSYRKERDKWAVMIKRPDGKQKLVGYFDHESEAALAYNKAARKYFGDHAFQNDVTYSGIFNSKIR